MRKALLYIALFSLTLLTGCEEMFYREVDFKGDTEPEMLVVTSNLGVNQIPHVYVSHSFFFDRTDKSPLDWITDANVNLSVNGKAYTLTYRPEDCTYANLSMPALRPLDTVDIVATHPKYATGTVRQIMPGQIRCKVSSYEQLPTNQIAFRLDLDPYSGNPDDVIGIRAGGSLRIIEKRTYGGEERTDTNYIYLKTLYSNDVVFAEAANASADGYYGAPSGYYLYFPASALREPKSIQLFVDDQQLGSHWLSYATVQAEELVVDVIACTYSGYRFDQSTRSSYYMKALPTPSHLPQQDMNIMEEIAVAIQSMLGDQEPVQVYSNVEGGLGHVAAYSRDYHLIEF